MTSFKIERAKTAFLVVDMQNVFVDGPLSPANGLAVLDRINELARVCRQSGIQLIYTAHVVRQDGSDVGIMGEIIPPVRAGAIDDGSESANLHAGIELMAGDIFLKKPRFGAFQGTELELILRGRGVDTLILGGIATNVCCETTAREANVRDFKVIFLSDGTATFPLPDLGLGAVSAEEIQRSTCTTLAFAFAEVTSVADVITRVAGANTGADARQAGAAQPARIP
jgi:ureidoacrylate peracid hydrolase